MTIGDLFDILQEKLKTGEFDRTDSLDAAGYEVSSIEKVRGDMVRIYIEEQIPDCSNCFAERESDSKEQLDGIRDLLDEAEEVNMSNYDDDQVADLNNFYIEVCRLIEGKAAGGEAA